MILDKIRQVYPQLTKSQKKLADFIASSYQEAAFMTASRLARHLSINEATVIRFAQRLGYPGYPQLIRDVQAIVQEEIRTRGEMAAAGPAGELFLASLNGELEMVQRTVSHVSAENAQRIMALLAGRRRIVVAGQGFSYHLAGTLAGGLAALGLDARLVAGDPESLGLGLASLEAADALVGISATRDSPEIARALAAARERGAATLAVTGSPVSAAAQAAEIALTWPANDRLPAQPLGGAAILLDALVQAMARRDAEGARRTAQATAEAARALRG